MPAIPAEIAALLAPISQENPAGINLEYEPLYDDIRQALENDPSYLPQDEWTISEPRKADWQKVRKLCATALEQQSKDLQLSCWFVEALTHLQGLTGLETGLHFLREFITRFWFQCWPPLDEDGAAFRYSKLTRLDLALSETLCMLPLLKRPESSLAHWRMVLAFEHKICTWPDSRDELIAKEGDLTMASFDALAATFSSIEISQLADVIDQVHKQLERLETCYFSLSTEESHALFTNTQQTLIDIADFLQSLTKRAIPVGSEMLTLTLSNGTDPEPEIYDTPIRNQVLSREQAISQMLAIAHFFRQTEPSSPVPFLMDRAASWANMTLTEWLEEMLSDSGSLKEINNVLIGQSQK